MDENIFLTGQVKYTKEFLLKANKTLILRSLIPFIIIFILGIIGLIYVFTSNVNIAFIIVPIVLIVIPILATIRLILTNKNAVQSSLNSTPNASITYSFTLENFYGKVTSDTSSFEFNKKYSDVKKTFQDKEYYYIFFDNTLIPVSKKDLTPDKEKILLSLLGNGKPKVVKTPIYYVLIILFIFTILSPYLAVIFMTIAIANSPIPEFPTLMLKYAYIFGIMLIFPIASIITYFFYRKTIRCKKNLIGGIIVTVILTLFSTMSLTKEADIKTDESYFSTLETTLKIDFPNDYVLNYALTNENDNFQMMVKFNSKEEILKVVTTSPFVTSLDSSTLKSLPKSFSNLALTYDYLLTYDLENESFNTPIINKGYLIGYKEGPDILDCHSIFY